MNGLLTFTQDHVQFVFFQNVIFNNWTCIDPLIKVKYDVRVNIKID